MSIARPIDAPPADFAGLIAAHRGIILKVASSYCSHPEDRADLAQEIALQLWRAWPAYEPSRTFSTWMYRVALNVAISQLRRDSQRRSHDPLDHAHELLVGDSDVDFETRQRMALVQRAMQSLGPFDRALLLLHLEGCSHRESAEVLGTTEGNIATRLNRVRQQLRRIAGAATHHTEEHHGNA